MKKASITNVFLGIIAFCLLANLSVQFGLINKANAGGTPLQQRPTEVIIVGMRDEASYVAEDDQLQNKIFQVRVVR